MGAACAVQVTSARRSRGPSATRSMRSIRVAGYSSASPGGETREATLPGAVSRTYHASPTVDDWNVLATSVEGARPVLLAGLRRHGAFRGAGYRNVAIGHVADRAAFFAAFRDDLARDTLVAAAVGRVLPIDEVLQLDEDDPQGSLEAAVTALAPRVTGSFFVRLERRGLHGTLHSKIGRAHV